MNLKHRAKQLKNDLPALSLALKNPQTPLLAKVLSGLCIAYALSPIDLIPDFIPVLGMLDDFLILPALAIAAIKLIPQDVWEQYRAEAQNLPRAQKRWYFALPIIVIWLVIAAAILHLIF